MADKKKKRKKKKSKSIRAFWITLALTIFAGGILLLGSMATSKLDRSALVTYGKAMLQRVIGGENGGQDLTRSERYGYAQENQDAQKSPDAQEIQSVSEAPNVSESRKPQKNGTGDAVVTTPPTGELTEQDTAEKDGGAEIPIDDSLQQLYASGEFTIEDKVYVKETADPEEVSLVFAGDILFDDNYAIMARLKQRGGAIENSISTDMLEVMRSADIFMVNNEFPYSNRGEPTPDKKFTFRGRPEYASYLLDMGADIVSLANNHASDYGTISLTDTIDVLNSINMPFVGAGRNLEEAAQTAYFVANDMKIAILSATQIERMENPATKGATDNSPGVFRCLNIDRLLHEIQEAKRVSDFVIVYIHWGTESTDQIDWAQREQAPKIAEAGADLIIGDHPHVLQPIGYCGDVPVVYSLGNYLFNSKAQDTCLVRAVLDTNGMKSLQFIPGRQQDCSVTMHYGEEKERVLTYMRSISPGVNIDADGYITKQ